MNRVHEQCPKIDSGTVPSQTGQKTGKVHRMHSPDQPARPCSAPIAPPACLLSPAPRSHAPVPCVPAPRVPARPLAQLPVAPARVPHARLPRLRAPRVSCLTSRAHAPLLRAQLPASCRPVPWTPSQRPATLTASVTIQNLYRDTVSSQPLLFYIAMHIDALHSALQYNPASKPPSSFIAIQSHLSQYNFSLPACNTHQCIAIHFQPILGASQPILNSCIAIQIPVLQYNSLSSLLFLAIQFQYFNIFFFTILFGQ